MASTGDSGMKPDWMRDAKCANDPAARLSWFFPLGGDHTSELAGNQRARALCRACPVRELCLAYAVDNYEHGIWADTNDNERRAIRRRRRAA